MKRIADLQSGSWAGMADFDGFRVTRNEFLWLSIGNDALEALASDDPDAYLEDLVLEDETRPDDFAILTMEGVVAAE